MFMNILTVLNPAFWFSPEVLNVESWGGRIILMVFVILFLAGLVLRVMAKQKKEDRHLSLILKKVVSFLVTMGLLGLILYFFSFENVRVLGSRFWYVFWMIGFVVWLVFIISFIKKDIPAMKAAIIEAKEKEKYLPNAKRR